MMYIIPGFCCHPVILLSSLLTASWLEISDIALLKPKHPILLHSLFAILKSVFTHEIRRQMLACFET